MTGPRNHDRIEHGRAREDLRRSCWLPGGGGPGRASSGIAPRRRGAAVTALSLAPAAPRGLALRWRTLEWWGCGGALMLQTGVLFPLLMAGDGEGLSDAAMARLRLLALPGYLVTLVLLAHRPGRSLLALRRTLLLSVLALLPFVSVLWSVSPSISLRRAVGLLLSLLLAYLIATRFTPRQLLVLVGAVLGACMALSLALVVVQPGLAWMPSGDGLRGAFLHKNVLGWYAALATFVGAVMASDRASGRRGLGLALFLASLACLIASQSATALLVALSAPGLAWFYAALARRRGLGRTLLVLVVVQLVALLLLSLHAFLGPLLEALDKDPTLTGRVPLWALVDAQIGHGLVLGFGYGAFWTPVNPEAWRIWGEIGWMAPHAHNGYRDTLLSFGIGGAAIFAVVLAGALWRGARLQIRAPGEGWLWLNVWFGMFLVMNLTESLFLVPNAFLFTLFAAAIVMVSIPARAPGPQRYPSASPGIHQAE